MDEEKELLNNNNIDNSEDKDSREQTETTSNIEATDGKIENDSNNAIPNDDEKNKSKKSNKRSKAPKNKQYLHRGNFGRFIVNIVIPVMIPFIITLFMELGGMGNEFVVKVENCSCSNISECTCELSGEYSVIEKDKISLSIFLWSMFGIACINTGFQLIEWIKEHQEINLRWKNEAAKYAYNDMFEVHMSKNTQLRTAYHRGLRQGMLSFADVPYDVFDQIRKISWELCNTIGQITKIEKKDLSAAFIYRYTYDKCNNKDKQWRWITGKGSKFNKDLNTYVEGDKNDPTNEKNRNVFYDISHEDKMSVYFCNDKLKATKSSKVYYNPSYRDESHSNIGSFFCGKGRFFK